MKRNNRIIAVMLSLSLILTMIPCISFAEENAGDNNEEVVVLNSEVEENDSDSQIQSKEIEDSDEADTPCTHEFKEKYSVEQKSCYEPGYIVYVCTKCQETQTKTLPVVHSWGEWEIINEPDCTLTGEKIRECWDCGITDYRTIPAIGHRWSKTDLYESNYVGGIFIYGKQCTRWECPAEKYVTFKIIKKGKSKNMFPKKRLKKFKKTFKKYKFYSSNKKVVRINKKTGKMKGKKKGTAIIGMKFKYKGEWFTSKFQVVVK